MSRPRYWNVAELQVIGYLDALALDFVPCVVEPVCQVRGESDVLLGPPYESRGDEVSGTVLWRLDFEQAVSEGNATRIDPPRQARENYLLWVDSQMKVRYEPEADARGQLNEWVRTSIAAGLRDLAAGRYPAAELQAQMALNANGRCLAALGITAAIQRKLNDGPRLQMLERIVDTIDPGVSLNTLTDWVDCLAKLNAALVDLEPSANSEQARLCEEIQASLHGAASVASHVELNEAHAHCRQLQQELDDPDVGAPPITAALLVDAASITPDLLPTVESHEWDEVSASGLMRSYHHHLLGLDERALWAETPDLQGPVEDLLRKAKKGS